MLEFAANLMWAATVAALIALLLGLMHPQLPFRWGFLTTRKRAALLWGVASLTFLILGTEFHSRTPEAKLLEQERADRAQADKLAEIARLDEEARAIPGDRVEDNLRAYRELAKLDSTNARYKAKVEYYSAKLKAARATQRETDGRPESPPPSPGPVLSRGSGSFDRYSYAVASQGNQYAVTFSPLLPRDDTIVIGAMLDVLSTIYGSSRVTSSVPTLVPRRGRNLIKFTGRSEDFYFLVYKQDTGEVHSFAVWAE